MTKMVGVIGGVVAVPIAGVLVLLLLLSGSALATPPAPTTDTSSSANAAIGSCAPKCPGAPGPQSGMSVKKSLELALSEVGTSRPTGWNMPGECIVSVRRWVTAGGGQMASGGTTQGYVASPALRVTDGSLRPGDVIQYTNNANPDLFAAGVHTFMIVAVHPDGKFDLVESNNPGGSGRVGVRRNTTAPPPAGWHSVVWRFASEPDS